MNDDVKTKDDDLARNILKYELAGNALGIALWDMEVNSADPINPKNVFTWSDEFRHKLGFNDERDFPNILQSWSDRLHPDDKERTLEAFAAHLSDYSGETPYDLEYRLATKSGQYRFFHAFGNTLRGEFGIPLRVAGAILDITEKIQMAQALREALRETEEMLESIKHREKLLNAMNETSIIFLSGSFETFDEMMSAGIGFIPDILGIDRITVWKNASTAKGLSASQIYRWDKDLGGTTNLTTGLTGLLYSEAAPRWEAALSAGESLNGPVEQWPEMGLLMSYEVVSAFIAPVEINNSFWGFVLFEDRREKRYFDEDSVEMMRSAAFLYVNAIRRVEIEQSLNEEKEFNKVLFEAAPIGLAVFDESLANINCNEYILDMLKTNKADFMNSFISFLPDLQPDGTISVQRSRDIRRGTLEGELPILEWIYKASDGEDIPCEITMARIKRDEKYFGISFVYDLRSIKAKEREILEVAEREREALLQREAAQASNEAKSRFLANMSHEIRTPMNAIIGMSDLLISEELNSRQHRFAEDIRISSKALLEIINDILDLSKIQAAKLTLSPVHYNIRSLVDNLNSMLSLLIKSKELNFYIFIHDELPEYLYGDDVRLRQVLLNLLSNAAKYTEVGGISLSFILKGQEMLITVADTGSGIPEEDIPTLFDAFERADLLNTRNMQGTGLGLSITKALVELMGGSISVESEYGIGSTFHILLPMIPGDGSMIKQGVALVDIIYAPDASVLAVDDRVTNLNVICGLLHQCQINADTATSGEQAIEMALAKEYDLIFMDHMMPGMDGVEATAVMRMRGVEAPIVALTANAGKEARAFLLGAGMDDFLSKPIDKKELYQILENWLPPSMITKKDAASKDEAVEGIETTETTETGEVIDDSGAEGAFWDNVGRIAELSVEAGLQASGNQKETYRNTLEIFIRETEKSVQLLKEYLAVEDAKNFRIQAHGLKGSLSLIGAMGLSAKALELEQASRDDDLDFCSSFLPGFLDELTYFQNELRKAFDQLLSAKAGIDVLPELVPILKRMKEAIDSMDLLAIYDEIDLLDQMDFKAALFGEVEKLKNAAMLMNYDFATEIIDRLLQ